VKQARTEKQKMTFIRLSRWQFKVWDGIVWKWQPKRPNTPKETVRYFDYCKGTNDCYTWAYWAKRKALEIMFVVPSR